MNLCLSLIVLFVKYGSVGQEWFISASAVPVKICSGEVEWEDGKRAMLMILPLCLAVDDSPRHGGANNHCVGGNTYAHTHTCKSTSQALQSCIYETLTYAAVLLTWLWLTQPVQSQTARSSSSWLCRINVKLFRIYLRFNPVQLFLMFMQFCFCAHTQKKEKKDWANRWLNVIVDNVGNHKMGKADINYVVKISIERYNYVMSHRIVYFLIIYHFVWASLCSHIQSWTQ